MSQDTLVHDDDDGAVDPNLPPDPSRRFWVTTACAVGGVAGVATAVPLVSTFSPRKGPRRRRSRGSGHRRHPRRRDEDGGMARQARVDHPPLPEQLAGLKSQDALLADPNSSAPASRPNTPKTKAARASPRSSSASASVPTSAARPPLTSKRAAAAARQLAGRLPLSVPRLHVRPGRPRLQEQARARQPRSSAVPVSERHPHHRGRRRRQQSLTPASRFHSRMRK